MIDEWLIIINNIEIRNGMIRGHMARKGMLFLSKIHPLLISYYARVMV